MAGDDVPEKKPDPSIYRIAAERLQLAPAECLVVEDSTIGLRVGVHAPQSDAGTNSMCCSNVTADVFVRMRVPQSSARSLLHATLPDSRFRVRVVLNAVSPRRGHAVHHYVHLVYSDGSL
jgi:phosphoglycolate phosphatase-like HAD superfamily hydrolase